MKILIMDYQSALDRDLDFEIELIKKEIPDIEIDVYCYTGNKDELKEKIKDVDIVETALTMLDREILEEAKSLKAVCFNSTGFNNVDMDYAKEHNIAVIPVLEYCTEEVASHAFAMMLALIRNIKIYQRDIDELHTWGYKTKYPIHRISEMTLGIFGLGKIGQAVAKRAQAFGMKVIAYDPYLPTEVAESLNVELKDAAEIFAASDVISNHMMLTSENTGYFDLDKFKKCSKKPIFINVARGASVVEADMVKALDEGYIRGAGVDVLEAEKPVLMGNPIVGRENVIITPHAAFYSEEAYRSLQEKAVANITNFIKGRTDLYKSMSV